MKLKLSFLLLCLSILTAPLVAQTLPEVNQQVDPGVVQTDPSTVQTLPEANQQVDPGVVQPAPSAANTPLETQPAPSAAMVTGDQQPPSTSPVPTPSKPPVGTLYLQYGKIQLIRDHRVQLYGPEATQIPLEEKDLIRTGAFAVGELILTKNHNEIKLFSNSFLDLSQINNKRVQIKLKIGRAKFKITKRLGRSFHVLTVNAMVGVKGTEFVVVTDGNHTQVATLSGLVFFANRHDLELSVDIPAGQLSNQTGNQAPSPPAAFSPQTEEDLLKESKDKPKTGNTKKITETTTKKQPPKMPVPSSPVGKSPIDQATSAIETVNTTSEESKITADEIHTNGNKTKVIFTLGELAP